MGFRFKKVIQIAPGVKLNISKSGISTSLGPNGATMNIGKNGVKGTLGIPGSGLSYQKQLVNKKGEIVGRGPKYDEQQVLPIPSKLVLEGRKPVFLDAQGIPFSATIQTKLKRAYAGEVSAFLEEQVNEGNEISNKIDNIQHYYGLSDYFKDNYQKKPYLAPQPDYNAILNEIKSSKGGGFFSFLNNHENDAKQEYQSQINNYNIQKQEWDMVENQTFRFSQEIRNLRQQAEQGHIESMNTLLEKMLLVVEAPIRFSGSFELDGVSGLWLDIDLPEIEEISDDEYSILQSGQISIKKKTDKKKRADYSRLVSGILFILASNVFELLPTIQTIVISGYTQRPNLQTGYMQDDYIYSYIVERDKYNVINLDLVDPFIALDNFTGVKQVTKSFEWKSIEPYYNGN